MTVYIGGVKVAPIQKTYSRIYFIEGLLGYLYHDLRQFKAAIELEHAKSAVKKPLQLLINKYCQEILKCADDYPTASGRITKKGKGLAQQLRAAMLSFDDSYSQLQKTTKVAKKKHKIICELNGSVLWFLKQHDMTVNSIKTNHYLPSNPTTQELIDFIKKEKISLKAVGVSTKMLPHRPKNWELRRFFKKVTGAFKKKNGQRKFIPYKVFCRALESHNKKFRLGLEGLVVSVKGYYNLKDAWRNGSLDRLV